MANKSKADLSKELSGLGVDADPKQHTAAELESMLAQMRVPVPMSTLEALPMSTLEALSAPGGVTRRKVNRGSTRRINRAFENFTKATNAFMEELDHQVFMTDAEGSRVDEHPLVVNLRTMLKDVNLTVASFTTPSK